MQSTLLWKKCFDPSNLCYTLKALETFLPEKLRWARGRLAAGSGSPASLMQFLRKMSYLAGTLAASVLLLGVISAHAEIIAYVDAHGRRVFINEQEQATREQLDPAVAARLMAQRRAWLPGIDTHISQTAKRHGVDPKLVNAIIEVESGWDAWAVSRKGAVGLMQLLPETGRRFGARNLLDPKQNITAGIRYLRFLLDRFNGNLELSLAAYNAGENVVEELGEIPPYPETLRYIERVTALHKGSASHRSRPRGPEPGRIYQERDASGRIVYVNF